jgi:hypothetical protein
MTTAHSPSPPSAAAPAGDQHGNAYNLFILVRTVASLLIMVLLWLPFSPATIAFLGAYDNMICVAVRSTATSPGGLVPCPAGRQD